MEKQKKTNWLKLYNLTIYNIVLPVIIGSTLGFGSIFMMCYLGQPFKFAFGYSYVLASLTTACFIYIYNRNIIK